MPRLSRLGRFALLVALHGASAAGCTAASDARDSSAPQVAPPATCDATTCAALAGPCERAECDSATSRCRTVPARDGEPCLEGNACGPAACRAGECVALEAAACGESTCGTLVCRPEVGACVPEASTRPGARCEESITLAGFGESRASADNACGSASAAGVCGAPGLGPSVHFSFDLSEADAPSRVRLALDAAFDFEAALSRGPCGDTALVECAAPAFFDGASRALTATLPPDRYSIIVTPHAAEARGSTHVTASIGDAVCDAPPANDTCAGALPLDPRVPLQSVIGSFACASPDLELRCADVGAADLFYELDLSERAAPTLVDIDVARSGARSAAATLFAPAASGCGEVVMCGRHVSALLAPGKHRIAVSDNARPEPRNVPPEPLDVQEALANPFTLRVALREPDCGATTNTTWQAALELDPRAERQRLRGNTACGQPRGEGGCNDDRGAPELYYRLDLRERSAPIQLELEDGAPGELVAYLLVGAEGAEPRRVSCPEDTGPIHSYFELAPRLYYIVIDGRVQNSGRFDVELSLSPLTGLACLDGVLDDCLRNSEPACAVSFAEPQCLAAAVECGLPRDTFLQFCSDFAGCCDGTAERGGCEAAWAERAGCN